jgi:hypothetical protein
LLDKAGLETENDIKEQEAEGKVHGGTERFVGDHRGSRAVSSDLARQSRHYCRRSSEDIP